MDDKSSTNRRQFLAAATTSGMALLAGCGSSSGNNSSTGTSTPRVTTHSGPADFRASLTGPSTITLGKSFRLTLDVINIGGQSGSLDTTVSVTEGKSTLSRPLQRKSVSPGESVTVRTDPIQFDTADTYTFSVGISEISHTVTVQPKRAGFRTAFDLGDNLQAAATNITFHPAILYSPAGSEQTYLQKPPSKSLLAIIRVHLENIGTESASIAPGAFQLANGQVLRTLGGGGTPLSTAKINGKPLTDLRLSPGEQRTGWVLAQMPRSQAQKTVTVIYQRDAAGTPPEIQWTAVPNQNTRSLPQFSLTNFSLPKTAMQKQDANATLTVSNDGNKTRTFRGVIQYRSGNSGDWRASQPITARIKPGESVRRNITINSSSQGSISYRLAPFETTKTVKYVPPTFAFGETYTTTENNRVTVSDLQSSTVVRSHIPSADRVYRTTPSTGKRFVLVQIRSVVVGESEGTPRGTEFTLRNGSQTFEKPSDVRDVLVTPVEAPLYNGYYDPDKGEIEEGYLVWSVPKQVPLADLTVWWTSREPSTGAQGETARWTKGGTTSR